MQRGKAILGDKTMLDALVPAAKEFSLPWHRAKEKKSALRRLEGFRQRCGRYSEYEIEKKKIEELSDLTIGYPEPGAVSISLNFQGLLWKNKLIIKEMEKEVIMAIVKVSEILKMADEANNVSNRVQLYGL